jgi:hypothetical protein
MKEARAGPHQLLEGISQRRLLAVESDGRQDEARPRRTFIGEDSMDLLHVALVLRVPLLERRESSIEVSVEVIQLVVELPPSTRRRQRLAEPCTPSRQQECGQSSFVLLSQRGILSGHARILKEQAAGRQHPANTRPRRRVTAPPVAGATEWRR